MFWGRNSTNSKDIDANYVVSDKIRVDSTRTDAFAVGKDQNGVDILTVDTLNGTVGVIGDLNVIGNLTFTELKSFSTADSLIKLANGNTGDTLDTGFYSQYVNSGTKYSALYRDASDSGIWKIVDGLTSEPSTIVSDTSNWGSLKTGTFTAVTAVNAPSVVATNLTGTLQTPAQANVTSLGTLTGLTMGGTLNLSSNNITNGGTITANTLSGTLSTASQPNITTLSGLTSIQSTALSSSVWPYVSSINQNLGTTNEVRFSPTLGLVAPPLGGKLSYLYMGMPDVNTGTCMYMQTDYGVMNNPDWQLVNNFDGTNTPILYMNTGKKLSVGTRSNPNNRQLYISGDCETSGTFYGTTSGNVVTSSITPVSGGGITTNMGNYEFKVNMTAGYGKFTIYSITNRFQVNENGYTLINATTNPNNRQLYVNGDIEGNNLYGTVSTITQNTIQNLGGLGSIQGQSISPSAWQYVNGLNQQLATTSSPTFSTVTASLTGHASLDLALSGGTMSGAINMGTNNITNAGTLSATTLTGTLSTASQPNITTLAGVSTIGTSSNVAVLNTLSVGTASPVANKQLYITNSTNCEMWVNSGSSSLSNIVFGKAGSANWQLYCNNSTNNMAFYSPGLVDTFVITSTGNIICGVQSNLSTSATDGFLYIPKTAGAPTGVPTSVTGKVPMCYDSTNNKLYVYNGSWKSTTFA